MEITGQDAELPEIRRRARVFALFAVVVFVVIACRLFYLQVIEGDAFYKLTSDSIIRTIVKPAVRGEIRDRKNRVLARMRPAANVSVLPREVTPESFDKLRTALALGPEDAADLWDRIQTERTAVHDSPPRDRDHPLVVQEDISRAAQAVLEEAGQDLPGVKLEHTIRRDYPYGPNASHVLGYMNEISSDELRAKKQESYRPGDLVGRVGIERQLEGYLRGRTGFQKTVVDRRGVPKTNIRDLVEGAIKQDPIPGNNVFLTLDMDLQKIAERAMRNANAGATVVVDVDTGRILAAVSKPDFDPNEMSGHLSSEAQARILADRFHPLKDKVLSETYFPGSTFKVVTALSALEDKLISPEEHTKCHGFFEIGRRRFKCTKTHGVVALYDAIVQSCNVYFYELGARPGMLDRLARFGTDMGLGAPSGLGMNGEESGFIATEEWYREQKRLNPKNEGFQVGHALNAAIGQETRVTVLQMAMLYAAIANGGKLWLPQIVERIESPTGQVLEEFPPRVRRELSVSPENLAIVRQALLGVVNEPKGTAYKARPDDDLEVSGKTGTAQVRHMGKRGEPLSSYEQNDHAWFAGFAPSGHPRIAFAVLVEHGGHGGDVAAPVAMEITHGYFESVAPADRAAPHLGLPRRRPGRIVSSAMDDSPPGAAPAPAAAEPAVAAAPAATPPAADEPAEEARTP